ncbi:hypothetical protein QN219_29550 [Sinorhizobium sp. 7-81]|uniref:hypothetical protein n=1 Tax=Sinorhizobium sp. 8-89 TaxID=3049089 RepID=UPI0024C26B34|nr:hypothetical protein [Sinorhizobium sp. 8-89]MDK1494121.1 hypothetical protein [Sinorhizobium sp. 8-89]
MACFQRLEREFVGPPPEVSLALEFGCTTKSHLTDLAEQFTGLKIALMEHVLGIEEWNDLAGSVEEYTG